jgi:hypothetical protein
MLYSLMAKRWAAVLGCILLLNSCRAQLEGAHQGSTVAKANTVTSPAGSVIIGEVTWVKVLGGSCLKTCESYSMVPVDGIDKMPADGKNIALCGVTKLTTLSPAGIREGGAPPLKLAC